MKLFMPTSSAQIVANRLIAQRSTGPISELSKVSANAVTYGIFFKQLILTDGDPCEYQSLLSQLWTDLMLNGILEQILVEKVVVSPWRQKRLIKAGAAHIELES